MKLSELIMPFDRKLEFLLDSSYFAEDSEYIDYHGIDQDADRYKRAIEYLRARETK